MLISINPLEAKTVRLVPLKPDMKAAMRWAVDCDPETWAIMSVKACADGFEGFWAQMLHEHQTGVRIAYAIVRQSDDKLVGTSSYLNMRPAHGGLEIGATFLHPEARAGVTNPQTKLLLLDHAFRCGALRAEFMVDVRNLRSQAAMAKLGAVREGVLRKHKITWTGHVRDTAVFSILDSDWPQLRAQLSERIAKA
jgi:RimJ/RimL family protein N-acetyltransferase